MDAGIGPAAIAEFLANHGPELRRFLFGVLRDADAVADVVQAACVKAVTGAERTAVESPKAWLFKVALNEALAWRRRQGVERKANRTWVEASARQVEMPDALAARGEVVEQVRRALLSLPEEQRFVVSQRMYRDKTFAQIATELGVPIGTVLTRMRLALEKLRRELEGTT